MNRRLLVIIASVIVILGLLIGGYFLFFGGGPSLTVGTPSNPFGSSGDRDSSVLLGADGQPIRGAGTVVAPKLIRISDAPVAKGAVGLYIPPVLPATSTDPSLPSDTEIRFIERQSGNIYAFRLHDRLLSRISNRTLPGIQDAAWASDGSRAFVRYLTRLADGTEQVATYALPADGSEGYFLEPNLTHVAVSGTSSVLSLAQTVSGSVGVLANLDGTNPRTLFTSLLSQLSAGFSGNTIVAHTRASSGLDGYAFLVSGDGSFTRILGPLRGLGTLPNPEGTSVLYSHLSGNRVQLQLLDLATRITTALPLATLAEKCVWAPGGRVLYCAAPTALSGNLPDDWYQGAVSFSDRLWRIDLETRLATLIVDPGQVADVAIDAVALALDPQADALIFTNKRDGTLWAYDL